jgi:hypothetical protein
VVFYSRGPLTHLKLADANPEQEKIGFSGRAVKKTSALLLFLIVPTTGVYITHARTIF